MWREQCSPKQGCSAAWTGCGYCCCSGSTVDDHHIQDAVRVGLWLDASSSQHLHPSPLAHSRRTSNFPDCDWFDPPSRWVDLSGKSLWGPVPLSLPAATIVSRLGDRDVQTGNCWRSKLAGDGILVDDNSALVSGQFLARAPEQIRLTGEILSIPRCRRIKKNWHGFSKFLFWTELQASEIDLIFVFLRFLSSLGCHISAVMKAAQI